MVGIAISLSACASDTYYGNLSTTPSRHYVQPNTLYDIGMNAFKFNANSVPYEDRQRHERCVYFALDTLNPGEACNWHGNRGSGEVYVAQIEPNTCTTIFNTITYNGKTKRWQDRGCLVGEQWEFFGNMR